MPHPTRQRPRRARALLAVAAAAAATLTASPAPAQTASWNLAISGTWSNPVRWSTNPAYPNSPSVDAFIARTGPAYTVTVNADTTVHSLSQSTTNATLLLTAGTLTATSGINLTAGSFHIGAGTLANTTLSAQGGATVIVDPAYGTPDNTGPTPVFDAVTLNADVATQINNNYDFYPYLIVRNGLTLANGHTLAANIVEFEGPQTIAGTGTIANTFIIPESGDVTLAAGITTSVTPGENLTQPIYVGSPAGGVSNAGAMVVTGAGAHLIAYSLRNQGSVAVTGGGAASLADLNNSGSVTANNATLYVGGAWTNTGTISAINSTVRLGGNFSLAALNSISRTGGSLSITGTLDNSANTLVLDAIPGAPSWPLATDPFYAETHGAIHGGTITANNPAGLFVADDSTLDGVTLGADITTLARPLTLRNTITLANRTITLSSTLESIYEPVINFSGPTTLAGTGQLVLANAAYQEQTLTARSPADSLTVGPGITIRTGGGYGVVGTPVSPLTLQGLVSAQDSGKYITLAGKNWVNQGVIQATNGGIIFLAGSARTADLGTLQASNGGQIVIAASLDNAAQTLTATPSTGNLIFAVRNIYNYTSYPSYTTTVYADPPYVLGGTLAATGGASYTVDAAIFDNVTLSAPTTVQRASFSPSTELHLRNNLTLQNTTLSVGTIGTIIPDTSHETIAGTGTIAVASARPFGDSPFSGSTLAGSLTLAPGISITGPATGSVILFAPSLPSVTNQGSITTAAPNGTLTIAPASFTNTGSLAASAGSTLTISSPNWTSTGPISLSAATLNLAGTFPSSVFPNIHVLSTSNINVSGTVINTGATVTLPASVNLVTGGHIVGGTVSTLPGSSLLFSDGTSVDNLTIDGSTILPASATLTATNNLTLTAGHNLQLSGTLQLPGGQTIAGPGTLTLANATSLLTTGTGPVTLVANLTLTGTGTATSTPAAPITNLATLWSKTASQTLTLAGPWTGNGPLKITDGTLNLAGSFSTPFLANLTQTGGSLLISGSLDNSSATLLTPGPTSLAGSITGGTVASPFTTTGTNASLNNLTLATDLTIPLNTTLSLNAVLLNNPTLSLAGGLAFPGSQTLAGTGTISFAPAGTVAGTINTTGTSLTLGPNITVAATVATGAFFGSFTNQGTLRATGQLLSVAGANFVNAGPIQLDAGRIFFVGAAATNAGTISAVNGSTLSTSTSSAPFVNAGTISATNSYIGLSSTWTNTGSVLLNGGTLALAGSSTNPGSFNVSNASLLLAGPLPSPVGSSFLNTAVTASAAYTTAQLLSLPLTGTSSITLARSGAIDNASYTLPLSANAAPWSLAGGSITGGSISSPDATPLTATTLTSSLSTLSTTAPLVVNTGATLNLTSVTLNAPLAVSAGSVVNLTTTNNNSTISLAGTLFAGNASPGTVTANPGSTLVFAGPTSNLAGVTANAATLTANATAYAPNDFRSLNATSSTFRIGPGSTLDNSADDLHLPDSNAFALAGGKITGGTLPAITALSATSTLDNATLTGELTMAGGSVSLSPTLTLAPGSSVRFTGAGSLVLPGNSLTGSAEITLDTTTSLSPQIGGATSLTVGPNISIHTGPNLASTAPVLNGTAGPFVNQGSISSQTPGRSITIAASSFLNTGTIEARDGGIIRVTGSLLSTSLPSLATIQTTNGGTAFLSATLNSAPTATLTLTSAHALGLGPAGSIRLGVINTTDNTPLTIYPFNNSTFASSLSNASVLAPVSLLPTTTLSASNTTFSSLISANAATLNVSGTYSLTGGLALSAGSTASLAGTATGSIGPVSLSSSTLNLNGPLSHNGITAAGTSTINLNASLTNTGQSISLPPTSTLNIGTSAASAITGGSIVGGGTVVVKKSAGVSLSNLTVAANLTFLDTDGYASATGLITLDNSHVSINSATKTAGFQPELLAGTGDISFDGTQSRTGLLLPNGTNNSPFSIPAGVTVHTGTSNGSVRCFTMAGVISAQTAGRSITLDAQKVTGAVEAKNGGTLLVTLTFPLLTGPTSALTLSSGTWNVFDASTMNTYISGYKILTLAPPTSVTLDGPNSSFPALSSLSTNAGSLTLTSARTFTTASDFTNTGTLTLGPSAALKVTGSLANPGTLSLAGGSLLIDYTGASPIDALRSDLLTHHLTTPLPDTAIAYAEASLLPPDVVTQLAAGLPTDPTTLLTKLTVQGDANLNGHLDPDDYALLDRSLAKATSNPHWTDGDFNYDGIINDQDYLLIDQSLYSQAHGFTPGFLEARESQFGPAYVSQLLASTPEPVPALACLVATLPLRRRRRRALR